MWLLSLNFLATILALAFVGLTLYKVRKIHLFTYGIDQESKSMYAQIQAFYSLDKLLQLQAPLPTLRGWAASPDFLLEIAKYALEAKPKNTLECSSGCSTIVLARCMQINDKGHVYSLEHDTTYAAMTRHELERQGLTEWATIVDAPLIDISSLPTYRWYSLDKLPSLENAIDMVVIDGPPRATCNLARYPAFPMLKHTFSEHCHLFLDDASRPDEKEIVARWLKSDPEWISKSIPCEKGCTILLKS